MDLESIKTLIYNKWFLVIAGGTIMLAFVVLLLSIGGPRQQRSEAETKTGEASVNFEQTNGQPEPTNSPEMQQAMDEAKAATAEYDNRQKEVLTEYPWLRTLPLSDEKYFVYYDLQKKVFVGRLYPKDGANIARIKTEAITRLRQKDIPTDKYVFEWTIMQ